MNATKYEATYVIANDAIRATSEVEKIVTIIKGLDRAVTCKELGELVYGDAYKRVFQPDYSDVRKKISYEEWLQIYHRNCTARTNTARLNQVLRHLVENGNIKMTSEKSAPYTYEVEEPIYVDEAQETEKLTVWDAQGRHYTINNPHFNHYTGHIEYRKVQKTGSKMINKYLWMKD